MTVSIYRGYSTVTQTGLNTSVHDIEVVKQDLRNEFNTRLGERVMRPNFGTIIWDLLFDLGDPRTESLVVEDARRVIAKDPRVDLVSIDPQVDLSNGSMTLAITLLYIEFDIESNFDVAFNFDQ